MVYGESSFYIDFQAFQRFMLSGTPKIIVALTFTIQASYARVLTIL